MDYEKIYTDIVKRGKERNLTDNFEKHHIIPKCIGGPNDDYNIVKLTYREHFVAHWLLHKIFSEDMGIRQAFIYMCYGTVYNNTDKFVPSSRIFESKKIRFKESFNAEEHVAKIKKGREKKKPKMSRGEKKMFEKWNPEKLL